jgi:formylglycine-generating enzyme required for sulfatase activity
MYIPGASVLVDVASFYMAKYLITNAQFAICVNETGQELKHAQYWQAKSDFNQPQQPVLTFFGKKQYYFAAGYQTRQVN